MLPTTHLRIETTSARSEIQPPGPIFWHQNPGTIISQGCRRMGLSFLMLKSSSRLNELLRCYTFPHKTPHPHSSALVFHGELSRHSHCISPNISPRFHRSTKDPTTATQPPKAQKLRNFTKTAAEHTPGNGKHIGEKWISTTEGHFLAPKGWCDHPSMTKPSGIIVVVVVVAESHNRRWEWRRSSYPRIVRPTLRLYTCGGSYCGNLLSFTGVVN